ncbi:MAG: L-erythro-3,5-diaminohexanoate dehydrogenase [Sandaracinaceae bacterium]|nr:L-erythro-3,5-diaminohexanoate dehydrogenase [Sandaracinaceae bacterium]
MATLGDPFGSHRAVEPQGSLPQAAQKLDNDFSKFFETEMLLDVETLNIDAASFRQMEEASIAEGDAGVVRLVQETVNARGKQHNPVTGSGGMLLGRVARVGSARTGDAAKVGDRVATLVSLSLTPLRIDSVSKVHKVAAQLEIKGQAVLFASGAYAVLPSDMSERLALAALDVAGAPPQVARICKEGESVLILGAGGKSGILCAYEARKHVGPKGRVVGVESYEPFARDLAELDLCDEILVCDARDPLAVREMALAANAGREYDRSISCVNVPDAEMSCILSTRDRGMIYFFSMTTSFTRAALGAEGVGKDVDMIVGNGFAAGHAEHTLNLLREAPEIRALFEERYTK